VSAARRPRPLVFLALGAAVLVAGCQSGKPEAVLTQPGKSAALRKMEKVALAAHTCWFASKDRAFRAYGFANELNSMSGQPRFLLVPRGNFGGRPLLVVEARGAASAVDAYGPLLEGEHGKRISADLNRWASGDPSCVARA